MNFPSLPPAFVGGAMMAATLVAALFFLKFWRRTHDGLFLAFAAAFVLMALNQSIPVLFGISDEAIGGVYLLRAAAFILIIIAILGKNLASRR